MTKIKISYVKADENGTDRYEHSLEVVWQRKGPYTVSRSRGGRPTTSLQVTNWCAFAHVDQFSVCRG